MALIGTIREKGSWLLIVLIGLGLFGFLIMDMFSGQTSIFGSNATVMGSVNGRNIDINEFNRTEGILYSNGGGDSYGQRASLWNYFVEETLVKNEAEELGLGVSRAELMDLQFGDNLSPVIAQRFQDPNTRQVSREQLSNIRQQIESNTLDPRLRQYWAVQEDEVIKESLQSKLTNLLSKSMYVPTWMAESLSAQGGSNADFAYVQIPFDEIDNADVALAEADYQSYLDENMRRYTTDQETRKVEYVVFDIVASKADSMSIRSEVAKLADKFRVAKNDTVFVENNYGQINPSFFKKEQLPVNIQDTVVNMNIGEVYGPYNDGAAYTAVKLIDAKIIPDSVEARHILLKANVQNQAEVMTALEKADSLKAAIEGGQIDFATAAQQNSEDASNASKGGDLGYFGEGRMVPQFNNMVFFQAEGNEVNTVVTQFGVHLIEVTGRKFETNETRYQLATVGLAIEPSEKTSNEVESRANRMVQENRTIEELRAAVAKASDLKMVVSGPLKTNDYIVGTLGSSQSSRDMVKYAFTHSPGSVSPEMYIYSDPVGNFYNKYVLAGVSSVRPAGKPTVANVRDEIEAEVMKMKKASMLSDKVKGMSSLTGVASNFGLPLDTARNTALSSGFIAGLGSEPAVVATVFQTAQNAVSSPIKGNSGVFMVQPLRLTEGQPTPSTMAVQKQQAAANAMNAVRANLLSAMKKNADISDNRSNFF